MKALRPLMLTPLPPMSVQVAWVRATGWAERPGPPYAPGNWDIWSTTGFRGRPR